MLLANPQVRENLYLGSPTSIVLILHISALFN